MLRRNIAGSCTHKKKAAGEGGADRFLVEPARAITGSREPD